jgi:3-oxo-5alpha-steroid 4-dehydrogenase
LLTGYNGNPTQGEDPEFHKYQKWIQPLIQALFAAIKCTKGTHGHPGDLKTSERGEVLTAPDTPVPGLFTAGTCASNLAYDSTGYSSGTYTGESTFFGRQCGVNAAGQGQQFLIHGKI